MKTEEELFIERLHFEHELINRRLTWLLTSQTILFAAYGFAFGVRDSAKDPKNSDAADFFLKVTAISGAIISALILVGIVCAMLAKRSAWKDYQKTHCDEQFGTRTWITYLALGPDILLPIVFAGAWIAFLLR